MGVLVWLIIGVAVALILYKFSRKTLKAVLSVSLGVFLILVLFGVFLIVDAAEYKNSFSKSKNIFVLSKGGTYITAVVLDFNAENDSELVSPYYNISMLEEYFERGLAPKGYYKVFLLNRESFESADIEFVNTGYVELSKEKAIKAMYSPDPRQVIARELADSLGFEDYSEEEIDATFGNPEELRRDVFTASLINVFGSNPMNLIEGVKNGNIIIYPETLMFKTIKFIPLSVFKIAEGIAGGN